MFSITVLRNFLETKLTIRIRSHLQKSLNRIAQKVQYYFPESLVPKFRGTRPTRGNFWRTMSNVKVAD